MAAELGTLLTSENRQRPDSRLLELSFLRLKSLSPHPGPPIVYLAGGPGGSGIEAAQGARYPVLSALRQVADVIVLDQRGIGKSAHVLMLCRESWQYPIDQPGDREAMIALARHHSRACADFLARNHIDATGYNNVESADDIEDLRRAIGAPRISLLGVSYGTSLALTALKRHPGTIERVVLAGVEGPGQQLVLPSGLQALLSEVDRLVREDRAMSTAVPEFLAMVRSVLDRLGRQPAIAEALDRMAGRKVSVPVGRFDLQLMTAQWLTTSDGIRRLPGEYLRMSQGDFSALADFVYRRRNGWLGQAMPYLVRCSLGTSPQRLARILAEEKTALLGRTADFPYPEICDAWGLPTPGPESWAPVRSDVPVLLVSGSLDGRTPPDNAAEVARGLSRPTQLLIDGAGHGDDLLLSSPEITLAIVDFLSGRKPKTERLALGPFRFAPFQWNSSSSKVP